MPSAARDRIVKAVLEGDLPQAGIWIADFVNTRLMLAGHNRDEFLAALKTASGALLRIALAVAEQAGQEGTRPT